MNKELLKNPLMLGVIFFVIYIIIGLIVPNKLPGASVIEVLAAILITAYGYVYLAQENITKKQRKGVAAVFFIGASFFSILILYSLAEQEGTAVGMNAILFILIFSFMISLIIYIITGSIANIAYMQLERKKHYAKHNKKRKA